MTTEQFMLQHEKTTNRKNSAKRSMPTKGTRLSTTICTWEIWSSCVTTSGLISCPVHSATNQCLSLTCAVPPSQKLTTITRSGEILLVSRRYSIHCRAFKKWVVEKSMSLLGQSCRQHRLQSFILRIRVSAMLSAMQAARRISSLQPLAKCPCNNDHSEAAVFPAVWMTTRSTRTMQNA